MNGTAPLTPDQQIMLDGVKVVAQSIVRGLVGAIIVVAVTPEGILLAEHITDGVDPHLVRGYLLEVSDRVRDRYVKRDPPRPIFGPDGSVSNG